MNLSTQQLSLPALILIAMSNAIAADVNNIEYFNEFIRVQSEATKRYEKYMALVEKHQTLAKAHHDVIPLHVLEEAQAQFNEIRNPLIRKYSWAIPNKEALETIKSYAPIIELGAGGGYWARLLESLGTDTIVADDSTKFNTKWGRIKFWKAPQIGDERLLDQYPERTLFLCWPDAKSKMASRALARYRGTYVIYVGFPMLPEIKYMGDPQFYEMLNSKFKIVKTVTIPQWPGNKDRLFIFERLPDAVSK